MRLPSTSRRLRTSLAAIASISVAIVLAVGPVSADTELGHRGQIGAHSLRDSGTRGGALCTYRTVRENEEPHYWEGQLRRVDVRPPRMRAIAGQQTVGWRFILRRSENFGRWKGLHRSAIQKSKATLRADATFSSMGVNVNIPARYYSNDMYGHAVRYQVRVRMFWYRADGTVQGRATHRVDFYDELIQQFGRDYRSTSHEDYCVALWAQLE